MSSSKQPTTVEPVDYLRISELARILGWQRTSVYYWLNKCKIRVVRLAGIQVIEATDLPRTVLILASARREAHNDEA